ncbi:MAG: hypothetical protein ACJA08_002842, partial [Cyclobacteriaceae bacterium]
SIAAEPAFSSPLSGEFSFLEKKSKIFSIGTVQKSKWQVFPFKSG